MGIDYTYVGPRVLLNAVEYAAGLVESRIISYADPSNTITILFYIFEIFGTPKKIITDNAQFFTDHKATRFRLIDGFEFT